jgi:hypothetical protein
LAVVPLINPSSVPVTDSASLALNLSQNSLRTICQFSAPAGALGIGAEITGLVTLGPVGTLATTAALVAAATSCPAAFSQDKIFGTPPAFSGGQCAVLYDFTYSKTDDIITPTNGRIQAGIPGPITGVELRKNPGQPNIRLDEYTATITNAGGPTVFPRFAFTNPPGNCTIALVRRDNQADNCGDPPSSGGQVIVNNNSGDTINNTNIVNNTNNKTIAPVLINVGGINGTLNLTFGDIKIDSLFPLNFNIDISGTRFGFGQKPDGTLEPRPVNPDLSQPATQDESVREVLKKLNRIIDCVCGPSVDIQNLFLPTVSGFPDCGERIETLSVQAGSFNAEQMKRFVETAALAQNFCDTFPPKQLPESLIFAASTTALGHELFTPSFGPEIVSLRLKITEVRIDGPEIITLYPGAQQRKYGSVSFVLDNISGGGDYIYLFDTENYVPLPDRAKTGRLRILMKRGISFEVYDTGERL